MDTPTANTQISRIGVFGGTFDPVHFGHLRPALEMCELLELNSLRLLPCHLPTHRDQPHASSSQRIDMLQLACALSPKLQVDDREARRSTPSYSVDTLKSFRKEFPSAQLLFFMGMTLAHLVVMPRPGAEVDGAEERLLMSRLCDSASALVQHAGQILTPEVAQFDISATRIRALIAERRDIRFLLPESVREYIVREQLYQ